MDTQMLCVNMIDVKIDKKVIAIVQFGPAVPQSGFKAGEYYQVTIDPNMASPAGDFIRFGCYPSDEIIGWQRIAAMTVAEVLCDQENALSNRPAGYTEAADAAVVMRHIEKQE